MLHVSVILAVTTTTSINSSRKKTEWFGILVPAYQRLDWNTTFNLRLSGVFLSGLLQVRPGGSNRYPLEKNPFGLSV